MVRGLYAVPSAMSEGRTHASDTMGNVRMLIAISVKIANQVDCSEYKVAEQAAQTATQEYSTRSANTDKITLRALTPQPTPRKILQGTVPQEVHESVNPSKLRSIV